MIEKFSISPSTNVMDVLGSAGYTFETAIEDIVDNSISANARNINIHIDFSNKEHPFLYILDDGIGMSLDEIKSAAIIGDKSISDTRESNQLGRYSTGLKSAANYLSNKLYICSKKKNQSTNTIKIDFKYIRENKEWSAFIENNYKLSNLIGNQGTLIVCDDLKKPGDKYGQQIYFDVLDGLINSLGHVYFKFIQNKDIKIFVTTNKNKSKPIEVKGWNPFFLPNNKSTKCINEEEIHYLNSVINVKSYILPTFDSLNVEDQNYFRGKGFLEQEGFYIYRANRLIYEGGWLNLKNISLNDKARYARVEIDIPNALDEKFKLNFSKDKVEVPEELINKFTDIALQAKNSSIKNYEYMKNPHLKPKLNNKKVAVWNKIHSSHGMILVINEDNPIIQEICKKLTNTEKKRLFSLIEKSLPVGDIQHDSINSNSFTEQDILEQLEVFYNNCVNKGFSIDEIKKEIRNQAIFANVPIEILTKFFDEKEEIK